MSDPAPTSQSRDTEEVVRLREENLRLRDQLLARDAEMGLMRGQVLELEAGAVRALHMLRRVKSIVPSQVWRILARLARPLKRG